MHDGIISSGGDAMNRLSKQERAKVVAALVEGNSVGRRAV